VKRFMLAFVVVLALSAFMVGAVAAQAEPVTYTVPTIDAQAVVNSAFGWLTGGIVALVVTMLSIRLAPTIVGVVRRVFSRAAG